MSSVDPCFTFRYELFRTSTAQKRAANVSYIKEHLGAYLRQALASAVMHQPTDPINFVANHLLKQRHADLTQKVADMKHLALQKERRRLCEEDAMVDIGETKNLCHPCDLPKKELRMNIFL